MLASAAKRIPKEIIQVTTNIHRIECPKAWAQLAQQEQVYAYHLSRAAWEGSKIG